MSVLGVAKSAKMFITCATLVVEFTSEAGWSQTALGTLKEVDLRVRFKARCAMQWRAWLDVGGLIRFMVAGCFGRWLLLWLRGRLVIALPAFPVCKVVSLGAGSTFVASELVASKVE